MSTELYLIEFWIAGLAINGPAKFLKMYKFKVYHEDGTDTDHEMTSNWKEVTTKQYQELRTKFTGDEAHLLEILTGVDREIWLRQSEQFVEDALIRVSWISERQIEFDKLQIPEQLTINGHDIKIPKELGLETFGQKVLIDNKLQPFVEQFIKSKQSNDVKKYMVITLIDYVAAVYLCPSIMGKDKFDAGDLPIAQLHVQNTPAYLIYPIAGFFLRKWIDSTGIGKQLSRLERRRMTRTLKSGKKPGQKG